MRKIASKLILLTVGALLIAPGAHRAEAAPKKEFKVAKLRFTNTFMAAAAGNKL